MTLSALEAVVSALGKLIDAPLYMLPTFGRNEDAARPEIRVDEKGYHFVIIERGQQLEHLVFDKLEEILFQILEGITFSMACNYEVRNRVENQDFRIVLFTKQLQLLKHLDGAFAERQRVKSEGYLHGVHLIY